MASPVLTLPVRRVPANLGGDISTARRRGSMTIATPAERAIVGRNTVNFDKQGFAAQPLASGASSRQIVDRPRPSWLAAWVGDSPASTRAPASPVQKQIALLAAAIVLQAVGTFERTMSTAYGGAASDILSEPAAKNSCHRLEILPGIVGRDIHKIQHFPRRDEGKASIKYREKSAEASRRVSIR